MINNSLSKSDPLVYQAISNEAKRQKNTIELIASENFASKAVMQAQGSVMTNKYAEGYPNKRYYSGCHYVDDVEILAQNRLKELFNCQFANVQPHSGSQANQAVYLALLTPGDTIMGMALDSGGHLTHGSSVNLSGKWFNIVAYSVSKTTNLIDYDELEKLALEHKPKLIIAGFSAYTRPLDFAAFRKIADKIGAFLLADIAHIAGIIAAGYHPSPFPHAHVVTSTTHKTLRGPRGGIILSDTPDIATLINKAIFPGLQGGPLMHIIAAKAVAFQEALTNDYKLYIKQVILNAKILADTLQKRGYQILTNGTDNHMVVLNLTKQNITGHLASELLEECNIAVNKNTIPFDKQSPFVTSGIRLGTPACTTRGFKETEFQLIANLIADLLDQIHNNMKDSIKYEVVANNIKSEVQKLIDRFPLYT